MPEQRIKIAAECFRFCHYAIHYLADDGPSTLGGIVLNGTGICQNQIQNGFTQEHTLKGDVGPLLSVGKNWLYFHIVNVVESGSGLLISAAITTT